MLGDQRGQAGAALLVADARLAALRDGDAGVVLPGLVLRDPVAQLGHQGARRGVAGGRRVGDEGRLGRLDDDLGLGLDGGGLLGLVGLDGRLDGGLDGGGLLGLLGLDGRLAVGRAVLGLGQPVDGRVAVLTVLDGPVVALAHPLEVLAQGAGADASRRGDVADGLRLGAGRRQMGDDLVDGGHGFLVVKEKEKVWASHPLEGFAFLY